MPSKDDVMAALAEIPGPDGRTPLPQSGAIDGVTIRDGKVFLAIKVDPARAGASAFADRSRSTSSVHAPSFGRGWTSRSYENAVSPDRRIRRTVLRDRRRFRAISRIDFPLSRCSRRIRPIVSTISIPHRPLRAKAGSRSNRG